MLKSILPSNSQKHGKSWTWEFSYAQFLPPKNKHSHSSLLFRVYD